MGRLLRIWALYNRERFNVVVVGASVVSFWTLFKLKTPWKTLHIIRNEKSQLS